MKHWNRSLLCMLTGLLSVSVTARDFEYDGIVYTVLDEEARTVETRQGTPIPMADKAGNAVSGDLKLPSKVYDGETEYTLTALGDMAFINLPELTSIELPETLTRLGRYALNNTGISEIVVPENVTEVEVGAIFDCANLTKVTFGSRITYMDYGVLKYSPKLTEVDISGLPYIPDEMFYDCPSLTTVTIPADIAFIGYDSFFGCYGLEHIHYMTENPVEGPYSAFSPEIYEQATLHVPVDSEATFLQVTPWKYFRHINEYVNENPDNPYPPVWSDSFEYEGLIYRIVDDANVEVAGQTGALSGKLVIPSFAVKDGKEYTVISIGIDAFQNDTSITSVVLPETVREVNQGAFMWCTEIEEVVIPEGVEYIGWAAFHDCHSLKALALPATLRRLGESCFKLCTDLESVSISEGVEIVEDNIFEGCGNLRNVDLPSDFPGLSSYMFHDCASLEELILPVGIRYMGEYVFRGCGELKTVRYMTADPITASTSVFDVATYRNADLYVPENEVEVFLTTLPWSCFYTINGEVNENPTDPGVEIIPDDPYPTDKVLVDGLYYIFHPETHTATLTYQYYQDSSNYSYLDTIDIPATVEYEGETYTVTEIGTFALYLVGATDIRIPDTIVSMGIEALAYATGIEELTVPEGVVLIEDNVFLASSLRKLILPDSVETLWYGACAIMPYIRHIVLGSGLKTVGGECFNFTYGLETLECKAVVPPTTVQGRNVTFTSECYQKTVLIVPDESVDAYRNHDVWGGFVNIQGQDFQTGISDAVAEGNANVDLYSMDGQLLGKGLARDSLKEFGPGMYIVRQGAKAVKLCVPSK